MSKIDYIFLDVDGTLTDGRIYYDSSGNETKSFHIRDGLAIVGGQRLGIQFVVITGRKSTIVERRMQELGIKYIFQAVTDKYLFMKEFMSKNNILKSSAAYIGDDLNDYAAMHLCELKACPRDACEEIKKISDYVSSMRGGRGAVRDIIEYVMKRQGQWNQVLESYLIDNK